ncbi:hypothetical protein ZIOFF_046689 [Zingiber officinale]|uniref:Uncharacterized protein n=1 Tax=Zingiber officinale TaxID=94328 RepID=A0A8J5FVX2_ZINOF|nr:hypothetical protein ZIOFF_046689 [Zingiber officinale]
MAPVQGSVGPGFQLWREENSYVSGVEIALFTRRLKSRNCKMDVHTLQQVLQEEMELHVILENALEHAAVTLSDLSYLPNEAQDLLSNTPSLEMTISRLEEEMTSLHFQLIQERNERRLTEYQLKQLPAQPSKFAPAKNAANDTSSMFDQEEKLPEKEFCQVVPTEIFRKQIPIKDLWNHPNQLAKEIVRCMKNIFISLADVSTVSSRMSSDIVRLPSSPADNFSISSHCSISESSISSWVDSPQIGQQYNKDILATGSIFDPYIAMENCVGLNNLHQIWTIHFFVTNCVFITLSWIRGQVIEHVSLIEQLAEENPVHLTGNEKLALWINLYNALIMHAAYTVGGHSFSAASIEYGTLKMKPPVHRHQTALLLALHKLKLSEEQKKFSIETFEPLVAFALNWILSFEA